MFIRKINDLLLFSKLEVGDHNFLILSIKELNSELLALLLENKYNITAIMSSNFTDVSNITTIEALLIRSKMIFNGNLKRQSLLLIGVTKEILNKNKFLRELYDENSNYFTHLVED